MNITILQDASDRDIAIWLHKRMSAKLSTVTEAAEMIAITLPGGSTPFPILEQLATLDISFQRLEIWPGDDRVVPEDHAASNVGKIRAILEPLGARIMPLGESTIPPHFALTWLGMGADGHIASLFPNINPRINDPLLVRRLTPDPLPPEAPFDRLSLTIPALIDCDELMFVIRGADKRALFEAAMRGENDLPIARLLHAAKAPITLFC